MITVTELMLATKEVIAETFQPLPLYLAAAGIYWLLSALFERAESPGEPPDRAAAALSVQPPASRPARQTAARSSSSSLKTSTPMRLRAAAVTPSPATRLPLKRPS